MPGATRARDEAWNSSNIQERVDMTATASEPSVESIGERGGIRDCNVEEPVRREDARDFANRVVQILKVFQAMVANYGAEGMAAKRETRGRTANKVVGPARDRLPAAWRVKIRSYNRERGGCIEAAGAASQIENERSEWEPRENFVHAGNSSRRLSAFELRQEKETSGCVGGRMPLVSVQLVVKTISHLSRGGNS